MKVQEFCRPSLTSSASRDCAQGIVSAAVEQMPFHDAVADLVIRSAVLHFARSREHFVAMFKELWRVLRPGGLRSVRARHFGGSRCNRRS